MTEAAHEVRVIEAYRDYAPPFNVAKTVRMLLGYVPAKYLAGLKTVVLMNKGAMSHDKRRRKLWSRGRKISMDRVLGTYHQAWKGDPAWIEIHVGRIISTLPGKSPKWVPPFPTHLRVRRGAVSRNRPPHSQDDAARISRARGCGGRVARQVETEFHEVPLLVFGAGGCRL